MNLSIFYNKKLININSDYYTRIIIYKMTTIEFINFQDVEKDVMLFISRNSGKLCSIHHIFNDIIDDRDIKNPDIRKDLKTKINIVMSQLDSKQNDVTVIKKK